MNEITSNKLAKKLKGAEIIEIRKMSSCDFDEITITTDKGTVEVSACDENSICARFQDNKTKKLFSIEDEED